MCQGHLALEIDALNERHAAIQGRSNKRSRNEGAPPSQLESGADYLVICKFIKDPKLFQAVSRELAQGALTQVKGLKFVDQSEVATEKPKLALEDDKQLHWSCITWDVSPVHEIWFGRMEHCVRLPW